MVAGDREAGLAEEAGLHELPILAALACTVLWMLAGAAIFRIFERDWTYFTSFYFVFVSLTTIGLGDTTPSNVKNLLANFWLVLLGLSLVSMCIQVCYSAPSRCPYASISLCRWPKPRWNSSRSSCSSRK